MHTGQQLAHTRLTLFTSPPLHFPTHSSLIRLHLFLSVHLAFLKHAIIIFVHSHNPQKHAIIILTESHESSQIPHQKFSLSHDIYDNLVSLSLIRDAVLAEPPQGCASASPSVAHQSATSEFLHL